MSKCYKYKYLLKIKINLMKILNKIKKMNFIIDYYTIPVIIIVFYMIFIIIIKFNNWEFKYNIN